MTADRRTARIAGLLYLVVVVTGIFSLGYVPSQLNADDPATTFRNIQQAESLFRLGIAAFLIKQIAFLLLPLALYRLLRDVHRPAALLMVAFAVASVPLALSALTHRLDVLGFLPERHFGTALTIDQLGDQATLALRRYNDGLLVTNLFWGLWLLPFGWLVLRSGVLPKILGVFLMLGCGGYLIHVFGTVLSAGYPDSVLADWVLRPAGIGEIGICLWLVIVGVRPRAESGETR